MKTRDEFAAKIAARKPKEPRHSATDLRIMVRDAVQMDLLTGDQKWDRFLSCIQAGLNQTQFALEAAERILADPRTVSHEDMIACKIEMAGYQKMHEALEWVMELPLTIKTTGGKARKLIKEEKK